MRAHFTVEADVPDKVLLISDNNDGAMSITNDAEAVVAYLTKQQLIKPGKRLVYRDTDGRWDELVHNGCGKFMGFAPVADLDWLLNGTRQ